MCRVPQVSKGARVILELKELAFQDLRVKKGQEASPELQALQETAD